jgi:hypothetical protein
MDKFKPEVLRFNTLNKKHCQLISYTSIKNRSPNTIANWAFAALHAGDGFRRNFARFNATKHNLSAALSLGNTPLLRNTFLN